MTESKEKEEIVGYQEEDLKQAMETRVKLMHVLQTWDSKNRTWQETQASKPRQVGRPETYNYVFKFAERSYGDTSSSVVYIYGGLIRNVLKTLTREDGGPSFRANEELSRDDLKFIYHQRHELAAIQDKERAQSPAVTNHELIFEIQAALDLIDEELSDVASELSSLPEGEITYDLLWTLFPPGSFVTSRDTFGQQLVHRVRATKFVFSPTGDPCYFQIAADYIDSNGKKTGFVPTIELQIPAFRSSRLILQLRHYPFNLRPSYLKDRETLISRADKVLRLYGQQLQEYQGHASRDPSNPQGAKFNSHGRIVLDPITLYRVQPNSRLIPQIFQSLSDLTDDQKLLVNPVLYGFSLGDKMWGAFAVTLLHDVEWNDNILNDLVISEDQKQFMRALVESHSTSGFDDFVRDKGKGLIGLLAGPPGVGKTLTAEAVAEIARRPLYMISSGELGSQPESVQRGLDTLMELAEAWHAVVLLDEADVFLVERDDNNLVRNAITSIFLRRLEYYQGILILTTNRHASFDPASKSRIHFYLDYPDLDADTRRILWRSFMARSAASRKVTVDVAEYELEGLVEFPLNGRQIKNIMNITQIVAVRRGIPITGEGIRIAMGFSHHLLEVEIAG
ncbi:AAA family ATPase [Trichoderma simmonsii]|uniref:AAA family ATPase n=1 Tax=Trichoderma simmonsii TaxID=1491479 RepID=A0A8G0LCC7_9HYPO|nr:AAA family ATPase [Trichoderma simmonsii]